MVRITSWALALLVPLAAAAELSNDGLIGPGLRSRPAYDGSAEQRTERVPVVRYFGPLVFVRSMWLRGRCRWAGSDDISRVAPRKQTLGTVGIYYTLLSGDSFGEVDWRGLAAN